MAKKLKGSKPSQRLPDIVAALHQNETGMTTGELASALGVATSTAREILSAEVKRGNIRRVEVEDDGATVFKFFNINGLNKAMDQPHKDELEDLMGTGDDTATKEQVAGAPQPLGKEAKRGRKRRAKGPNSGRGNPTAKKSINPQQTLEDKKDIAKELGGTMTWAGRLWHIKGPEFDLTMSSREIAELTLEQFRKILES
jgi:predicted transcriptional regulator